METVLAKDVDEAHSIFSQHMHFDESSWKSIFEFIHFVSNFNLMNLTHGDVRTGDAIAVTASTARAIRLLRGPHSQTVVAAYKHRRYSVWGKTKATVMIPTYAFRFFVIVVIASIQGLWR